MLNSQFRIPIRGDPRGRSDLCSSSNSNRTAREDLIMRTPAHGDVGWEKLTNAQCSLPNSEFPSEGTVAEDSDLCSSSNSNRTIRADLILRTPAHGDVGWEKLTNA